MWSLPQEAGPGVGEKDFATDMVTQEQTAKVGRNSDLYCRSSFNRRHLEDLRKAPLVLQLHLQALVSALSIKKRAPSAV